jgi:hypothetical protein
MQFSELIGQEVAVLIPKIHQSDLQRVLVVGAEGGGIWIESQDATNVVLQKLNLAASLSPQIEQSGSGDYDPFSALASRGISIRMSQRSPIRFPAQR